MYEIKMVRHLLPLVKSKRYLMYIGSTFMVFAGLYVISTSSPETVQVAALQQNGSMTTKLARTTNVTVPKNKTFLHMSMEERTVFVRERCAEFPVWKNYTTFQKTKQVSTLLIDDKYNLTFCFNMKVASTNIRRVFYTLKHEENVNNVNDIKKGVARHIADFNDIPVDDIEKSSNLKVTFVRDPLERLLSAYRDGRGFEDLRLHMDLTFKEFLQAIAMKSQEWTDTHLRSFFDNCLPCDVKYDYIGMTDTFEEDMQHVLQKINANVAHLPERNKTGYTSTSKTEMAKFLEDVSPRLLEFIWKKYRLDYYIFGFPHPKHWKDTKVP